VTPAPQAVLFDLDGLLVDSEPLWFEVERSVMRRLGGEWHAEDQRALLGGTLERSVGYMLAKMPRSGGRDGGPGGGPPPAEGQVAGWLLDGMAELMTSRGLPLRPGAAELLAEVATARIPRALVTSSQRRIMAAALAVTGMSFPVTVCGEDVRRGKPHPEPYLRAAELLGVSPGGCVVLEDSPSGVASAEAAGCAVIAVPSVPMPARPGRLTVPTLHEVSLATLRAVSARHQAAARGR